MAVVTKNLVMWSRRSGATYFNLYCGWQTAARIACFETPSARSSSYSFSKRFQVPVVANLLKEHKIADLLLEVKLTYGEVQLTSVASCQNKKFFRPITDPM